MERTATLMLALLLLAHGGCDQLMGSKKEKPTETAEQKKAKALDEEKKRRAEELASIDLKKVEQSILGSQAKTFELWMQSLEDELGQLVPGEKPLSINTTRSRISTWTPQGSFVQYALNLTGYVESNGQPGWQDAQEPAIFTVRLKHLGKDNYELFLTGPDRKVASQGERTIPRKNIVALFIHRKVMSKSGSYHTPQAREKELAAKRGSKASAPTSAPKAASK